MTYFSSRLKFEQFSSSMNTHSNGLTILLLLYSLKSQKRKRTLTYEKHIFNSIRTFFLIERFDSYENVVFWKFLYLLIFTSSVSVPCRCLFFAASRTFSYILKWFLFIYTSGRATQKDNDSGVNQINVDLCVSLRFDFYKCP